MYTIGRVESRQLLVPTEAPMVLKLVQSEEVRREERQRLKEKVLQMSESLDEEVLIILMHLERIIVIHIVLILSVR